MSEQVCKKCGEGKFKRLENHHVFPYYLRTEKEKEVEGETIILCQKCHTGKEGIHNSLKALGLKDEETIKKFTQRWITFDNKKVIRFCPICKIESARLTFLYEGGDFFVWHCKYCGYQEKDYERFQDHLQKKLLNAQKESINERKGDVSF